MERWCGDTSTWARRCDKKEELGCGIWIERMYHIVCAADFPCVSLLQSRYIWWCLTLAAGQTSSENHRWTSLSFTSGAKKENCLCSFRLYRPTARGTGKLLTSISKPISPWPIIGKVNMIKGIHMITYFQSHLVESEIHVFCIRKQL